MNIKSIIQLLVFTVVILSGNVLAQTQVPNDFQAGQPARAAEVNENFDTLESAIDQNAADIQQVQGLAGLSTEAAQIQTGLNLTSGLRWLVADYYIDRGALPFDNVSAGADVGTSWSNRFVESATIVAGVIEIRFNANAAAQIANQIVFLTPVDPGSAVVWFDCSGDGVTDSFLAELDCAFSDGPYKPIYDVRQQVATVFELLKKTNAQQLIEDYHQTNGIFPADNLQAGLQASAEYQNKYVTEMTVSAAGVITMTFGNDAHNVISGMSMRWTPDDTNAVIQWACDSLDIPNKYLPAECRT